MKILVVEDNADHRRSAEVTLAGHEVTIIKSFEEAMALLQVPLLQGDFDEEKHQRLMVEKGFSKIQANNQKAYWEAYEEVIKEISIPFPFDVVLTDMMMPMSKRTLAEEVYKADEQVPYGFIIALLACKCGAKFVAMVTDTNHHHGAMSAALDFFGSPDFYEAKPEFTINGARARFLHAPLCDEFGLKGCKDWGLVLESLIS